MKGLLHRHSVNYHVRTMGLEKDLCFPSHVLGGDPYHVISAKRLCHLCLMLVLCGDQDFSKVEYFGDR